MISIFFSVALVYGVLYRGLGLSTSSAPVQPIRRDTLGEHLIVTQELQQQLQDPLQQSHGTQQQSNEIWGKKLSYVVCCGANDEYFTTGTV